MKIHYLLKKAKNIYCSKWWTPINKIAFRLNGVKYGKRLSVRGRVYSFFHYDTGKIIIGDDVQINSAPWANPIGTGDKTYFQIFDNAKLIMGNRCGISNSAFTCMSEIVLGDDVLIGSGCRIYDTDFHALNYLERRLGSDKNAEIRSAPIHIGEGSFIGAGCMILKGVTIGKHSIVGAGSVVTKDIPDDEIWAGNPARFIRKIEKG